jgi:thiol-disulfide isomerase/thioredoxin
MDDNKIVSLSKFRQSKQKKEYKMLFFVIAIGICTGLVVWNYYVENISHLDVKIPQSKNIDFGHEKPVAMTSAQIANEFEKYDGKPILLYIYTTWCAICKKNFANVNEIAQEFQETELHIIALAIDRDLTEEALQHELNQHGSLYFHPRFLAFKEGFREFLKQKKINYEGRIPFTVLIGRDGKTIIKYVGAKNKNYLRNKIIRELYL